MRIITLELSSGVAKLKAKETMNAIKIKRPTIKIKLSIIFVTRIARIKTNHTNYTEIIRVIRLASARFVLFELIRVH